MMKINSYNPSFTGYSNVLASEFATPVNEQELIIAKLDDIGSKDLSKLNELRAMFGLPQNSGDVVVIRHGKSILNTEFINLNEMRMYSGYDLREARRNFIETNKIGNYIRTEDFHMKAYTYLANLTKRMMNDNSNSTRTTEFYNVVNAAQAILAKLTLSQKSASDIMAATFGDYQTHFQSTAKKINDYIAHNMRVFFK